MRFSQDLATVGESHPVDGGDVIEESNVSEYSMFQQAKTIVGLEPDTAWTLVTRHKRTRGPRGTTSQMEKTIKTNTSTKDEVNAGKKCPVTSYFE